MNNIKELLADEITAIAHRKDSFAAIYQAANGMFGISRANLSTLISIQKYHLKKEISIIDIMVENNMCTSKGKAKHLLSKNMVYVNDKIITDDYKISTIYPVVIYWSSPARKRSIC